ncbi:MAG: TRAM domain-containing protein [Candidatus Hydrogenedentes bacterium]|nr:TRAM domain-containing protein [Candidatus Hydrogenedentota bacterium]
MAVEEKDASTVVLIVRGIFVLGCIIMGGIWGNYTVTDLLDGQQIRSTTMWIFGGGAIGLAISVGVLIGIRFVTQEAYERLAPAMIFIVMSMIIGYFIGQYIMFWFPADASNLSLRIMVVGSLVLICGFTGIFLGLTRASNLDKIISAVERQKGSLVSLKLVDTSVIIDGRIAEVADSGFLEGKLLVPRFVLHELQHIADSSDVLRRAKGRRGLDILKKMQRDESRVQVEIIDDDPEDIREVDSKLVKLAKTFGAKVLTNDFNLNKVAQIEGVQVLNINDLANALKPAVLPDEQMEVKIIKEGKEPNQGVGYLDDGTMVVVDGGRTHMGKRVAVIVTSVLQTAAGRMIFTRFDAIVP